MNRNEAENLLQQLFDGTASESDSRRIESMLEEDPSFAELYREYALLHFCLQSRGRIRQALTPSIDSSPGMSNRLVRIRRKQLVGSMLAAAAIFTLCGVLLKLILVPSVEVGPSFAAASDSKFKLIQPNNQKTPSKPGHIAKHTTVELEQGSMELNFESGVRSIVTAPARFTLEEDDRVFLAEGSAWFQVAEGAEGFQVRTPGMLLTDRGTRFGVISVPDSTDEVHVIDGIVEVNAQAGFKESRTLHTGQSARVTPHGKLEKAPRLTAPFPTSLPDRLHYLHFPFDDRNGDSTVVLGNHPSLDTLETTFIQSDKRPARSRIVEGRHGTAADFDGRGDHILTNWPGVYGNRSLTLACWARVKGAPNYGGFAAWGTSKYSTEAPSQCKFLIAPNPSRPNSKSRVLRCSFGANSGAGVAFNHTNRGWHHYAVVIHGAAETGSELTLDFYIDGKHIPVKRHDRIVIPPTRPADLDEALPLVIGSALESPTSDEKFSKFFKGSIDELFIIEGALNDKQIANLYRFNTYDPTRDN